MRLVDLHYDVLQPILDHLDQRSLNHLSLTCRVGHHLAIPFLLRDVTLRGGWDKVVAFCRFVVADTEDRALMVKTLRLSATPTIVYNKNKNKHFLSTKVAAAMPFLRRLLQAACNLHTISLSSSMGVAMNNPDFGIRAALLQLPRLVHLVIDTNDDIQHVCHSTGYCSWDRWTGRQEWFNTIGQMHGLRTLELAAVPGASLYKLLQPHQSTMERLVLRGDLKDAALGYQSHSVWERVRELVVHNFAAREPLVRAFPNLRFLNLDVNCEGRVFYSHTKNQMNVDSEACWPALDHVRGTSLGIVSLRLKCPVRRLDIDLVQMAQILCMEQDYTFEDVLKVTKPAVLSLRTPTWFVAAYCRSVASTLPKLRCLSLEMLYDNRIPGDGTELLMTLAADSMMQLRSLRYLSLRILHPRPAPSLLCSPVNVLHQFVSILTTHLPCLEYLEITWDALGWQRSWWHKQPVELDAGGNVLNFVVFELSSSLGLAARRRFVDGSER
ncbi:uncharacterized protein FIBRA_04382 [Fibroporia radiculosa]|uniref:F-box domain-containing protein n=1 Tax=Fibroporia radiculosa TaxID=599839 RepID=J4H2X7_9APHY|nr:uncharacterized protein FIBRA_04382 [Fibroporia radiculosa]CCM02294.1 predicted protein [Fibroporia radiculosa]